MVPTQQKLGTGNRHFLGVPLKFAGGQRARSSTRHQPKVGKPGDTSVLSSRNLYALEVERMDTKPQEVQTLPIGRIGNPELMDPPKRPSHFVWSTGLPGKNHGPLFQGRSGRRFAEGSFLWKLAEACLVFFQPTDMLPGNPRPNKEWSLG